MTIQKAGVLLTSLDAWLEHAGPKGGQRHWKDGRSAKECARTWLGGGADLPSEVAMALHKSRHFGAVRSWRAEPEARLRFDRYRGEPRNSDLIVYADDDGGPYVIAVEAKADESFGPTVNEAIKAAHVRLENNPRSKGVVRAVELAAALFGREVTDRSIGLLRYQLLTACAGAVAEAERLSCARALLLVHEFVTNATVDANHGRNSADLNSFVCELSLGSVKSIAAGEIAGPIRLPGIPLFRGQANFFVGKVTRELRSSPSPS